MEPEPEKPVKRDAPQGYTPKVEILSKMWAKITDTEAINGLVYQLREEEQRALRERLGELYFWDSVNPGGHYSLNMRDERSVCTSVCIGMYQIVYYTYIGRVYSCVHGCTGR